MSFRHGISFRHATAPVVLACVVSTAFAVPARAGFLDQLFGGASHQPQPAYQEPNYQEPNYQEPNYNEPNHNEPAYEESLDPSAAPPVPRKVVREVPPVRQKTTDLMRDKTLRVGDAVMMKDGIHVYNGPESARHSARQFVAIEDARAVSSSERAALVAIDTTRHGAIAGNRVDTLASGRSAAVGVPVTKGFRITDARGASIRYVGP